VAAVGYYARANKHDLYQTYLRIGKKLCGADKPDIDFALKLFNKIPFDAGPIYVEARLEIKKLQSG
jgi:hypothetical protein